MFNAVPNLMSNDKKDLIPEYYAIVDWVANNPMSPNLRYPVLIAMNITPEEMERIKKEEVDVPPGPGTVQRAYLKIEDVIKLVETDEEEEENERRKSTE